jgi:hypothetical protein
MSVLQAAFAGGFCVGGATATANTKILLGIPPMGALGGKSAGDVKTRSPFFTHITSVVYTTTTTAHIIYLMRPKNYTTVASAAAISQAVINITADPGIYSTNFDPLGWWGGFANGVTKPACCVDRGIAANDFCAYQLKDGTWVFDTVSSVSTLAITMTTNVFNVTGGGVLANAPFYFFGLVGDIVPQTGQVHTSTNSLATTNNQAMLRDTTGVGHFQAFNGGDPLLVVSSNATNAGILEQVSGFYSRV